MADAPRVFNRRHALPPPGCKYVGRGSKWGNPLRIGEHGDRDAVCEQHERWLATQPSLLAALDELTGHDLVCWCAPLRCHADLLLRLANDRTARRQWLGKVLEGKQR